MTIIPSHRFDGDTVIQGTLDAYSLLQAGSSVLVPATVRNELALGNRVSMLGDSITAGSSQFNATFQSRASNDPLNWASLLTNSKVVYQTNAGITGNLTTNMLARIQTDIITPGCDVCVVMGGTNDAGNGVTIATYSANITAIVAALQTAGIIPVLCTVPPQPTTPIISPTRRKLWDRYNAWLAVFCERNGIALANVAQGVTDAATGGYLSAYDSGDGIHPTSAGARVMGQAIADAVSPLLGVWRPPVTVFETTDAINMIPGGLFQVDTNADGVADGWTKSGAASGTASLVTDAAILGKWQRLTDGVSEFGQIAAAATVTTGWAVGDRLAFCGRFKNDSTGGQVNVNLALTGSGLTVKPVSTFSVVVPDSLFYQEVVVPAATTSLTYSLSMQSSTALDARMAQMTLLNLTSLGLA